MENVVPSSDGVYVSAVHNEDNEDAISNQAVNMDDMIGQEADATDVDASVIPNGSPTMASALNANPLNSERINFRLLLNEEKVESYDCVLPQDVADVVKTRYENTLVGYFLGKSLAFPIVQNYVNNVWSNFGLQKLMKTNEGVFMFKFASKEGLEKVLQRGPWMIRKSPIILTKWSSTLSLKKGEVTQSLLTPGMV
ncbi:retrovirus-related pol polyprotein from transposon TNT 1-94 [Tanacetum coccineum]